MPNRLDALLNVDFAPEKRKIVSTGELKMSFEPDDKHYAQGIQNIGTSEEALNVGDVSDIGLIILINRSDTNFIQVGLTGSYTIKVKPGEFCCFTPDGTITAIADTAAVDVEYYIFPEDT